MLVRYVRAACPQQAMDEYTPDVWFDIIGDLDFAAAREAVVAIKREKPFVDPSDILTRVKRVQRDLEDRGRIRELLDPETYRREVEQAGADLVKKLKAIGAGTEFEPPASGWKSIECPVCHVAPGRFCVNPETGGSASTHARRRQAAGQ